MNQTVLRITVCACSVLLGGIALHAQTVDIGIFHAGDSTLEIRVRPQAAVTALPFSNIVFTIRWLAAYGTGLGAPASPLHAVEAQGPETIAGAFRYQKFAAAAAQSVTWSSMTEIPIMTVPVRQTASGTGVFSLGTDSWVFANNGGFYAELAGVDVTGVIYHADATGVPLPVTVESLSADERDGQVVLRWKFAGTGMPADIAIERRIGTGDWTDRGHAHPYDLEWRESVDASVIIGVTDAFLQYRLRLTAPDGTRSYSAAVMLRDAEAAGRTTGHPVIAVHPNPAHGACVVTVDVRERTDVTIQLYDVLGRRLRILRSTGIAERGAHAFTCDLSGLAPGIHFIVVSTGGIRTTVRLAVTSPL